MAIPVIKLSDLEKEDNQEALENLRKVSRQIGTFYLVDHGIDLRLIKKLQSLAKDFFRLPNESKEKISIERSPQFRGYASEGGEYTDGGMDFREQINLGVDEKALKWDLNSPIWHRLKGHNLLPDDEIPELRSTFNEWLRQTQNSSLRLLKAFAKALNLDYQDFEKLHGESAYEHCKLIRYPAAFDGNTQGVGAHKDGGLLTYVFQDEQSGLEGFVNKKWLEVPVLENSVVVNIGECLEMATNGYLKATVHRVRLSPKERFSIAYFLGVALNQNIPIFKLDEEFAKEAKGVDTDPNNPLLRDVADNYFKRLIRSHPQVAKVYHSDLIERFKFA